MPALGYLELTGTIQGEIKGGATRAGRDGEIEFLHFWHQVEMTSGNQHGLPLGIRLHRPIAIVKVMDTSSPRLMQLLCTEERISEAVFSWYAPTPTGEEQLFYRITLENAFVVSVKPEMPDLQHPQWADFHMMETVSFIYEKIIWSWGADGQIEFEDEWN
ncbi:MAG: type VI secretion system tube protein Hcp [Gammaproteobacteria bacterium]|nr:type VI secretion system tube protein Hcp [Gammaproteobacteria bacterium]